MQHFSFVIGVAGVSLGERPYEDALYDAGCDDDLSPLSTASLGSTSTARLNLMERPLTLPSGTLLMQAVR